MSGGTMSTGGISSISTKSQTTFRGWLRAVRCGEAGGPQGVISHCKLPDEQFERVLTKAYKEAGGLPGF